MGKVDLPVFLQQKLAAREGNVVEIFPDFYGRLLEEYPGYAVSSGICGNDPDEVKALARAYHYKESDGKKIGTHIGAQYYTIRADICPRHFRADQYDIRRGGT